MQYKHTVVPLPALLDLAQKTGAPVGADVVEHFLNVVNKGRRVVGFAASITPDNMPHYHFLFEDSVIVQ